MSPKWNLILGRGKFEQKKFKSRPMLPRAFPVVVVVWFKELGEFSYNFMTQYAVIIIQNSNPFAFNKPLNIYSCSFSKQ